MGSTGIVGTWAAGSVWR